MKNLKGLKSKIFSISNQDELESCALDLFRYQYETVEVYHHFCNYLKVNPLKVKRLEDIPFLPISFFKTHQVIDTKKTDSAQTVFQSSGTTAGNRSKHYVRDLNLYEDSFFRCFKSFFGNPSEAVFFGLLPNYLEQGNSSLVYMVNRFINYSNSEKSGFYLYEYEKLVDTIKAVKNKGVKNIILFGVSYALMDLADLKPDFSGVKIIETGGMKGRRKEMTKEELHAYLKERLNVESIYSEYGMTELLSQAYFMNNYFYTPGWMKVLIRDINDPFSMLSHEKSGGINVIDLANIHSCSFIATDDLGKSYANNKFQVLGRIDNSDVRGCNLLVQ